jgi:hypothetical protein
MKPNELEIEHEGRSYLVEWTHDRAKGSLYLAGIVNAAGVELYLPAHPELMAAAFDKIREHLSEPTNHQPIKTAL